MARLLAVALLLLLGQQLHSVAEVMRFSPELLSQAFVSRAGETQSLPPEIAEILSLGLRKDRHNDGVFLAKEMAADPLFVQRATETLYPIRLHDVAPTAFGLRDQPVPPGCRSTRALSRIVLYACAENY